MFCVNKVTVLVPSKQTILDLAKAFYYVKIREALMHEGVSKHSWERNLKTFILVKKIDIYMYIDKTSFTSS